MAKGKNHLTIAMPDGTEDRIDGNKEFIAQEWQRLTTDKALASGTRIWRFEDGAEAAQYTVPTAQMNAERALMRYVGRMEFQCKSYSDAKAGFLNRVNLNPKDAITWRAENMVQEQAKYEIILKLDRILGDCLYNALTDGEVDLVAACAAFEKARDEFVAHATERMMSDIRGSSRSTSAYSNAVEMDAHYATTIFLTREMGWWGR